MSSRATRTPGAACRAATRPGSQAPAADPHAGHAQQATPTSMPAATPDPHAGHLTEPTATPTPQTATPAPVVDYSMHQTGQPQSPVRRRASSGFIPEGPVVTLEELERMAAERNPTLAQADAFIRAAEGRRRQAGAFPNPVVGYFGEGLAFRAAGETSEHGVFVEQTIPLGGKLGKSKRIFEREKADAIASGQRLRVTNSVRMLYYETLGAQQLVELRADLSNLARGRRDHQGALQRRAGRPPRPA